MSGATGSPGMTAEPATVTDVLTTVASHLSNCHGHADALLDKVLPPSQSGEGRPTIVGKEVGLSASASALAESALRLQGKLEAVSKAI